jgi:Protein of unknown function (DUF3830)
MRQVKEMMLSFVDDGVSARAVLLEDEAPRTCRAIWGLLPLAGEAIHAAYSGTLAALYFDPTVVVPAENATPCLQTGDVAFTHYEAGVRHGHPAALSEVYWAYDRYARPTIPGQWLPATANVFGRIVGEAAAFYAASRDLRRTGVRRLEIRPGA